MSSVVDSAKSDSTSRSVPAGYKQTEVGVIPEDWNVPSLCEITEPQRPISYGIVQTGPIVPNGIRCLRVLDINEGRINKTELITTSRQISDAYRRTVLKDGDLVMPLRGKVGDVGLVDAELEGANLTRGVALIAVRSGWSPVYCQQVISCNATRKRLEQAMNGSALQEIPIASLRAFRIPTPSGLPEQRAIASALSDVDALLGALDRLIAKKRDLKQAAMQQLLTGQTRLPGFARAAGRFQHTPVGTIPDDWSIRHIADIAKVVRGGSPRPAGDPKYFNGSFIPWLTVAALTNVPETELCISQTAGCLTEIGSKLSRILEAGTLIIANSGATLGVAKLLAITCCANDGIAALLNQLDGDRRFMCYFLNTQTRRLREVVATGNGQPNLNTTLIGKIPIPWPSVQEQTAIASVLSDMDAELSALEQRLAKTRALKQGMMQELLTGRTRLLSTCWNRTMIQEKGDL